MEVAQKRWNEKFKQATDYDSENDDSLCGRLMRRLSGSKRNGEALVNPRVHEHANAPV